MNGHNRITVRGSKADLDEMQEAGLYFETIANDMDRRFFGPENIKSKHSSPYALTISYKYAGTQIYPYLEKLLRKYPTCWFKNTYSNEHGITGIWIGRFNGDTINIQTHEWLELSYDEICFTTDFSGKKVTNPT
jgi:hypothetical protein